MQQLTDKNIVARKNEEVVLDIEFYQNYFLVCVEYIKGGKVWFESLNFNHKKLRWILENNVTYTFNGNKFDMTLLKLLFGKPSITMQELHQAAADVIANVWVSDILKGHGVDDVLFNHVDLIELPVGRNSLKTYAGRLHAKLMQDLPYHPYKILTDDEKLEVLKYCWNDTGNTILLKNALQEQITLREKMSLNYGVDLRSKSDAQIAEAVIVKELSRNHNVYAKKPKLDTTYSFYYTVPSFVKFQTPELQKALETIRNTLFTLDDTGKVVMPRAISSMKIRLGDTTYALGIGGLHSTENWISEDCSADECEFLLIDRDVASYYPNIILTQRLFPKHLTVLFLDVYGKIVATRLAAKAQGDNVTANTLKIVVNGSFGKFGSPYSALYSPDLMIQVTLSGQLYLLMLIEQMVLDGHAVISGNTDGFVTKVRKDRKNEFDKRIAEWETLTGLLTEETLYTGYYGRDVNNYVAVKPGGKTKTKGYFAGDGLAKNPAGSIIGEAVANQLSGGVDVDTYIRACTDIRKFLFVRKVEGGCLDQNKQHVGKVIRWYVSKKEFRPLRYASNGHKVPQTQGARPLMTLTPDIPSDLSYEYYIRSAKEILRSWSGQKSQLEFDI
jgi:hypothetical protein